MAHSASGGSGVAQTMTRVPHPAVRFGGVIEQAGMPPHTMTCKACGTVWDPPNAQGKNTPTDSSLDRAAKQHWATCTGKEGTT